MEKTLRKFTSHEEARTETYRYWRSRLQDLADVVAVLASRKASDPDKR